MELVWGLASHVLEEKKDEIQKHREEKRK